MPVRPLADPVLHLVDRVGRQQVDREHAGEALRDRPRPPPPRSCCRTHRRSTPAPPPTWRRRPGPSPAIISLVGHRPLLRPVGLAPADRRQRKALWYRSRRRADGCRSAPWVSGRWRRPGMVRERTVRSGRRAGASPKRHPTFSQNSSRCCVTPCQGRGGGISTRRSPSKRTRRTWSLPMRAGSEQASTRVTSVAPSNV